MGVEKVLSFKEILFFKNKNNNKIINYEHN
jgi:hypothetical protein